MIIGCPSACPPSSVRHGCIIAKRCEIGPKLLNLPLITNKKSHIGFQMT